MATVETPQITETDVQNTVTDKAKKLGVKRYFTIPGRDPFDEIEWEVRDAFIPGKEKAAFDQKSVEFPKFWSQTATNIVAQKYFRGKLGTPERETSVKQMIGRVVDTIGGWGRDGGYFATDDEADTFESELKAILVNQLASFNSPVWFNVGFEEKPQCSACFILSIDDSMESILDWIRREGVIFRGGSGSGANLSRLRSSKEQLSKGGYASGPVSFMRGADASAGTIKSGGKTRRAAKMVILDVDHPDIEEFIWCKAREEQKARVLEAAGYDMSLDSADWSLDPVPEREQLGPSHRRVHGGRRDRRRLEPHRPHRRHRRRHRQRPRPAAPDGRRRLAVRRPGHAVRHDDQRVAHAARTRAGSTRPTRARSTCRPRRLRLQPRLAEPDQVPPRGRRARHRGVRARGRRRVPGAGDPGRLLVLPDARDRAQREGLPRARPRLREPRRAADGARAAVRLRRGPRLRRRDHGADDRPRLPQVGRDRRPHGPVRRPPAEPGGDDQRDLQAPRRRREHRALGRRAGGPDHGRAARVGRGARPRRGATATATRRRPCWRRPGRSAS